MLGRDIVIEVDDGKPTEDDEVLDEVLKVLPTELPDSKLYVDDINSEGFCEMMEDDTLPVDNDHTELHETWLELNDVDVAIKLELRASILAPQTPPLTFGVPALPFI